jgi:EAL domain-containing protein (putative c-di-GMP-specific phosphodiesterase class I)
MDPSRNVERSLERLAGLGVRIALDDFGTGYSSLAYLKRFPVDVVKIDRAFVSDLEGDASSVAICGAIVGMAHALAKDVVAEGVETSAQAAVLRRLGCDFVQGYHYAPPLPAAEYAARLLRRAGHDLAAAPA